jgi:hypothetical protein
MYSPRKTWESSQPYGWQASRAGGLEGRKNTDWELDKPVLAFVFGWLQKIYTGLARDIYKRLLIHGEWFGAMKILTQGHQLDEAPGVLGIGISLTSRHTMLSSISPTVF